MTDFYTEKSITIGHYDGWRYVVSIHDDPQNIKIELQERDYDSMKWVTTESVDGLWSESAHLIGRALIELAQAIELEEESL